MKTSLILSLTALAALSSAELSDGNMGRGKHRVQQVPGERRQRYIAIEHANTARKYGVPLSKNLSDAEAVALIAQAKHQSTVTAKPQENLGGDVDYLIPVSFGGTSLLVDADTGSSDPWVFTPKMPAAQRAGHKLYSCSKPLVKGESWKIKYGTGMSQGVVTKDAVSVGGLTVANQDVECATSASRQFTSDKALSGLFGLGFASGNQVRPKPILPWVDNALKQLSQPLFTAHLKHAAPGSYDFGFIDAKKHTGTIKYAPVIPKYQAAGFWGIESGGFAIGSGKKQGGSAAYIVDTGTSVLYAPNDVVREFYNKVKGAKYDSTINAYVYPCSSAVPSITFFFNGAGHTIPGALTTYRKSQGSCEGGIQPASVVGTPNILGDIFIKSQFVVFDHSGPKVGLAPSA